MPNHRPNSNLSIVPIVPPLRRDAGRPCWLLTDFAERAPRPELRYFTENGTKLMSRSKHLLPEESGDIVILKDFHQTIQRFSMHVLNIPKNGKEHRSAKGITLA